MDLGSRTVPRLASGEREIAYGFAQESSRASREDFDGIFEKMNQPESVRAASAAGPEDAQPNRVRRVR
jgi:hypothetical protein